MAALSPALPRRPWHAASLRSLLLWSLLAPLWGLVLAAAAWQTLAAYLHLAEAQDARLRTALQGLGQALSAAATTPMAQRVAQAGAWSGLPAGGAQVKYRVSTTEGAWIAGERSWVAYPWRGQPAAQSGLDLYTSHWQGGLLRAAALVRQLPGEPDESQPAQAGEPVSSAMVVQVGLPLRERWPTAGALLAGPLGVLAAGALLLSLGIWASVTLALRWLQRSVATLAQPLDDGADTSGPAELHELAHKVRALYRSEHDWVDEQRRFLAEASHQLRTPMAVLRTQLQSAIDGTVAPAEVLPQMLHTVDRATGLANQLLSLTKLEQLKRSGGLQPTDIHAAARDAVMELSPLIAAKRLDFSLDGEALDVPADAVMLGELLRNLLANAIHHTPHGGALGMLLRDCAGTRELVVWDEGPGVDDGVFPRLFQPFSATKGGVGLGLSICRQIADAMGASIHIYNRIDQGKVIGVDAVVSWGQGP